MKNFIMFCLLSFAICSTMFAQGTATEKFHSDTAARRNAYSKQKAEDAKARAAREKERKKASAIRRVIEEREKEALTREKNLPEDYQKIIAQYKKIARSVLKEKLDTDFSEGLITIIMFCHDRDLLKTEQSDDAKLKKYSEIVNQCWNVMAGRMTVVRTVVAGNNTFEYPKGKTHFKYSQFHDTAYSSELAKSAADRKIEYVNGKALESVSNKSNIDKCKAYNEFSLKVVEAIQKKIDEDAKKAVEETAKKKE
ncbi:MAG: hypothetical protein LBU65_11195 [Planctomycetaceae bacterium]|jgi:hypothetical protein|nr:hypothetical protein [Planctomycetaceae bacterium]